MIIVPSGQHNEASLSPARPGKSPDLPEENGSVDRFTNKEGTLHTQGKIRKTAYLCCTVFCRLYRVNSIPVSLISVFTLLYFFFVFYLKVKMGNRCPSRETCCWRRRWRRRRRSWRKPMRKRNRSWGWRREVGTRKKYRNRGEIQCVYYFILKGKIQRILFFSSADSVRGKKLSVAVELKR